MMSIIEIVQEKFVSTDKDWFDYLIGSVTAFGAFATVITLIVLLYQQNREKNIRRREEENRRYDDFERTAFRLIEHLLNLRNKLNSKYFGNKLPFFHNLSLHYNRVFLEKNRLTLAINYERADRSFDVANLQIGDEEVLREQYLLGSKTAFQEYLLYLRTLNHTLAFIDTRTADGIISPKFFIDTIRLEETIHEHYCIVLFIYLADQSLIPGFKERLLKFSFQNNIGHRFEENHEYFYQFLTRL